MAKVKLKFTMELDTNIEASESDIKNYKKLISEGKNVFDKEEFINSMMDNFDAEKREDIKILNIESYIIEE